MKKHRLLYNPTFLILSLVGVFRTPRGLSIAGLVISFLGLILLIVLVGAVAAAF